MRFQERTDTVPWRMFRSMDASPSHQLRSPTFNRLSLANRPVPSASTVITILFEVKLPVSQNEARPTASADIQVTVEL